MIENVFELEIRTAPSTMAARESIVWLLGRKVDFKNTLIIMTSNIGVRQLKDFGQGVGFATTARQDASEDHSKTIIQNAIKRTFSPEFLNRIDDVVIFNALGQEEIFSIIDLALQDVVQAADWAEFYFGTDRKREKLCR